MDIALKPALSHPGQGIYFACWRGALTKP